MKLRDFLNVDGETLDFAELYLFLAKEPNGTQVWVSKDGFFRTLGSSEAPNLSDGGWDEWVLLTHCVGDDWSPNWVIQEVYNRDGNVIGYIDQEAGGDTMLYMDRKDCLETLVREYGPTQEFKDEILDTEVLYNEWRVEALLGEIKRLKTLLTT